MDDEAGRIDLLRLVADDVAVHVDLHQVRSAHFIEAQPVRIDQEVVLGTGDTDGRMGPDELRPSHVVDDAICGGELHPQFPFTGVNLRILRYG